jgi:SAM-dependent methyltransferase
MGDLAHYAIRGGVEGHQRLKVVSRAMHPSTCAALDKIGITDGMACLDIGCGSGDVTFELARRVGPKGKAVGADIDDTNLDLARKEAEQLDLSNVEFCLRDIRDHSHPNEFDFVHARFLLTHLSDPIDAVEAFHHQLKPGGWCLLQDIDFTGLFVYPECFSFRRYHELYCHVVRHRGGDPDIGPRLPLLLRGRGFTNIGVSVVQPMACEGEVKLVNALTMENIADAVLEDKLASREEIDSIVRELYDYAANPATIAGTARIVQSWGQKAS